METILTVIMMAFIVIVLLGVLLVVEVVNFIIGQPVSLTFKLSTFTYLGVLFTVISYFAARKIYNLMRFS